MKVTLSFRHLLHVNIELEFCGTDKKSRPIGSSVSDFDKRVFINSNIFLLKLIYIKPLILSPNLLKSQSPISMGERGSPNLLKSQSPTSRGEGGLRYNFQLLMLSPNLLKSQSSISGGRGFQIKLSTFDAESKSAKIPKFHFPGGGGGPGCVQIHFPSFDTESKSAKIPVSHFQWGGGVLEKA